ncbi:serine hydrolase [Aliikangiella coralliicola]|uniref:Serine hydrolase n=1 Tax=Aliikangiella coralliicola TaxID=2592383 RepID=A0A545UIV7_9GAMM|nr:serine hydrolase [Aliikangiella coralliicola]TQV89363.1 serine hydrolase [Aliikangiella coralliicola]
MKQTRSQTKLTYLLAFFLLISSSSSIASSDNKSANSKASDELLIEKTNEIIKQYTDPGWFSGNVVIFKDDKVIYDKSFGFADIEKKIRNTSSTKIRIGSINKHFTAALVMQKVQAGKISLDDKLEKFELGFPKHIAEKITVRHLLKHTSGFGDIFNNEYFQTYRSLKNINDKLPLLLDKPLISEPGTQYNYSNYGYIVLGAILEKLERKSFQSIINENILEVIKADNTDYALTENVKGKAKSYHFTPLGEKIDRTGRLENLTPDGGMYSTPYDIALFYSKLFYSDELLNDKSKAIIGNGYKESTRTWIEILNSDKAHWNSYGGGPGVSAAVEILIKDKLIVIALANTDGLVAEHISQRVVEVYQGKQYKKIRLPIALFTKRLLEEKGDTYFVNNAKRELAQAGYENYGARPLNKMGFALIKSEQISQAISVFKANTKIFPKEPNTFDSLAYAYEKNGDKTQALLNYKKALSLDSGFKSAKEAILRLSQ